MKQLLEFVQKSDYGLIGVTGSAGAGKTSFSNKLLYPVYSADFRFVGDSAYRKELLKQKAKHSISSYTDACNQFNWWDWNSIYADLTRLKDGQSILLDNAYDRDTGSNKPKVIEAVNKIIYEGAILGPDSILNTLDIIIFVYTPDQERLNRLLKKDSNRRTINEIIARFLITEYSETLYYRYLFDNYKDKIIFVDSNYNFIPFSEYILRKDLYIPLPI